MRIIITGGYLLRMFREVQEEVLTERWRKVTQEVTREHLEGGKNVEITFSQ